MKKRMLVVSAAIIFLIIASCKDNAGKSEAIERKDGLGYKPKNKEVSRLEQVMDGHDFAMARMMKISKYPKQIKNNLDSISKLPAKKIDENYQQTLIDLQEDLNYAE